MNWLQWLRRILPPMLTLAAVVVVLVTLFSGHSDKYGAVNLPPGGVVALPEGKVKLFVEESTRSNAQRKLSAPLRYQLQPVAGGASLTNDPDAAAGASGVEMDRSQVIGSEGALTTLEVPTAGDYVVSGALGNGAAPVSLSFGIDRFTAVAQEWKLIAILIGLACLVWILPHPRSGSSEAGLPSSATQAYTGPKPYNG